MDGRGVLGIDFGTANTYICKCPEDQVLPEGTDLDGDGRDGLPSVILYRQGKEPLVGSAAYQEFGDATAAERANYTFRAQFKPDIVTSAEARDDAITFLKRVLENARRSSLDLEPAQRRVTIGVPAEAKESFRGTLAEIAREAGYGIIQTIEEPLGALFHHVARKSLSPSEAMRRVLVIDFGGGTCDFTLTDRGRILKSWGDMYLGGRLFDDLFYQWLIEQNPDVAAALDDRDEFYVISHVCRNLKEEFSREMTKRARAEAFTRMANFGAGRCARLSDASWESFVDRASRFRPSPAFARHLRAMGVRSTSIREGQPTDLVGWFKNCLADGLIAKEVDRRDIATVILTGGSSQWPFVTDIVRDVLHVEAARIRRSDRPYAAISQGLAIRPALHHKLEATKRKLEKDRQQFLDQQLGILIEQHIQDTANDIAHAITSELFDEHIKGTLVLFRQNGGKIVDLKLQVAEQARQFEPRVSAIVTTATDRIYKGLPTLVKDALLKWFADNGLNIGPDMLKLSDDRIDAADLCSGELPDLLFELRNYMTGIVASIVGVVTASICGGGGTALIMSGPIGWLIGLAIGAAVAYWAAKYGMEKAQSQAAALPLKAWMLRVVLRDGVIASAREKLRKQTHSQVLAELRKLQSTVSQQIEERVNREIKALTELHSL